MAFKKRAEDELKRIALKYSIDSIPPIVMDNAMKAIEWHKSLGNKVVIVSASIDIYLHPWCKLNGLEVLCSEMEFKDGKATGRYLNGDCSGKLKKLAIINNYDLTDYKEIYAYGDTKEDLEMLSIATKKYINGRIYPDLTIKYDLEPIPVGVIVAGSLDTDSAQKPERTRST